MNRHLRFFIRLDLSIGCHHCYGRSRSLESLQLSRTPVLLTEQMHRSSCVDNEVSFFRLCRRVCRHYRSIGGRVERIFRLLLEFINILCQFPGVSAGAPFLFSGFGLRSFLEFGSPWISLPRFALLNDSLRSTLLFPNFHATHRGLLELDCVIRSQLSIFPENRLSLRAIMGHTTQ